MIISTKRADFVMIYVFRANIGEFTVKRDSILIVHTFAVEVKG